MSVSPAISQDAAGPETNGDPYLLRMMHTGTGQSLCVLLKGDGQYHLERDLSDSTEVFEGTLSLAELQMVESLLNQDEFLQLSPDKIQNPLIGQLDELLISVHRPGYWQNLIFPMLESRKPYERLINPLLKWLEALHKEKHVELSEDEGKHNCLPPGKIELHTRSSEAANSTAAVLGGTGNANSGAANSPKTDSGATAAPVAFAMKMVVDRFKDRQVEVSCTIVYPSGRYHRERKVQKLGSTSAKTDVYEDSLLPAEFQQLRQLLDNPELVQRPSDKMPPAVAAQEGEVTSLSIPRSDRTQKLIFWKYSGVVLAGTGRMPIASDNGVKVIKPLNQWLKANIEGRKDAPLKDSPTNNCAPVALQ